MSHRSVILFIEQNNHPCAIMLKKFELKVLLVDQQYYHLLEIFQSFSPIVVISLINKALEQAPLVRASDSRSWRWL